MIIHERRESVNSKLRQYVDSWKDMFGYFPPKDVIDVMSQWALCADFPERKYDVASKNVQ